MWPTLAPTTSRSLKEDKLWTLGDRTIERAANYVVSNVLADAGWLGPPKGGPNTTLAFAGMSTVLMNLMDQGQGQRDQYIRYITRFGRPPFIAQGVMELARSWHEPFALAADDGWTAPDWTKPKGAAGNAGSRPSFSAELVYGVLTAAVAAACMLL